MFGSHGFQQKTQSFVAQTGEIGGILFHKFLLFFVCRKGRNKICYIRHIFSVFLKFTPKFGRVLLRSLDGVYSEVWTGFTPKFGRDLLRSLDGILLRSLDGMGRSYTESAEVFRTQIARMERTVWNINVQKLLHKMPLIWTRIARIERTVQDLMRKLMKQFLNINGEKNVRCL